MGRGGAYSLRVLHIWNTAGVASVIAKYMDRILGTESLVVHRKAFDRYGVTTYGELWDCGAKVFALRCLLLARRFDIIHVHSLDKLVPFLKILYPGKPVILHYHGNDIRNKWSLKRKYWSKADAILYSTPDLLNHETPKLAVYLPNPVDTDLFHKFPDTFRKSRTALAFKYHLDIDKANSYAKKYGLSIEFLERNIPHNKMPEILNKYEYYIDQTQIPSLSKTALEALACGLKVIRWDGEIIEGLPEEHKPENVVISLVKLIKELTNGTIDISIISSADRRYGQCSDRWSKCSPLDLMGKTEAV
jgi:glycosyltransferase involved in cell wall biosynthesis